MRRLFVVVVVVMSVLGLGRVAGAQEGTAVATPGPHPAMPGGPCTVEPRSAEELIALWYRDEGGTPVRATPEAAAAVTSVPAPLGEPVDRATADAVEATVREVINCTNLGELGRAFGLFSENLIRQFGPEEGETPEDVRAFLAAPPEPLPEAEQTRVIAVTDVSTTADGRVAAFVVSDDPTFPPEGPETELIYFVREGDRWLIDGVVEFTVVEADGGEGTPAA
jgi:hypothetical protein